MKKLLLAVVAVLLQGCAVALSSYIPSFWDDNQSAKITSVRLDIDRLDCKQPQLAQVAKLRDDLHWFRLYSESKGSRQTDVLKLTEPMEATIEDWYKRVSAEGYKDNAIYCEMKKKVVSEQAARAAKAILGRF
jgi:hypothetical protein